MQQVLLYILAGAGSAVFTFLLQKYGGSAVVASCLVGLIGAALGYMLNMQHLTFVIFTGSFVGMTSLTAGSIPLMLVGGALSGFIYLHTQQVYFDYGGRLGFIAFISTMATVYLFLLVVKSFDYVSKS